MWSVRRRPERLLDQDRRLLRPRRWPRRNAGPRGRAAHRSHRPSRSQSRRVGGRHEALHQRDYLTAAGEWSPAATGPGHRQRIDFEPVVKLFTPWGNATWPLTEIDPEEPDLAFGLCDLGMGFPELGSVSITKLTSVAVPFGLKIERDLHFAPKKTLSAYASEASTLSRINA